MKKGLWLSLLELIGELNKLIFYLIQMASKKIKRKVVCIIFSIPLIVIVILI